MQGREVCHPSTKFFDFLPEIKSIDGSFAAIGVLKKHIQVFPYLCSNETETSHNVFRRVCGFVFLHKDKCSVA